MVERKNRTLQEIAGSMLMEYDLPLSFWAEATSTACFVTNRVLIRPLLNKTCFELYHGHTPNISYFRVFGCRCYILNTIDKPGKFEAKTEDGIFIGSSERSKAYRIVETSDVRFEEGVQECKDDEEEEAVESAQVQGATTSGT